MVKIFNTDVTLAGLWNVAEAYPEWFGAVGDGTVDDVDAIQNCLDFCFISKAECRLQSKTYNISKPLIDLWNEIKNNPKELCDYYENEREKFVKDKEYYYEVRKRFNQNEDCKDFLFLLRTCANGMPRWNSKGEFNTPVHHGRDGIKPETFREICYEWSKLLNDNNVQFINQSYENITINADDLASAKCKFEAEDGTTTEFDFTSASLIF